MRGAAFPRARGRQQGTGFWFVLLQPIFRIVGDPREAFLPLGISVRIKCGLFRLDQEHALFFCYGLGANGKTTFLNAVLAGAGDYHNRHLLRHSQRQTTTDIRQTLPDYAVRGL